MRDELGEGGFRVSSLLAKWGRRASGTNLKMLQMGTKTKNVLFKIPKINPQSNPNKFSGLKRCKLT